jgi:hypothetical protein
VVEVQEQVFSMGLGSNEGVPVQQRGSPGEPALRAGYSEPLAAENVPELPCQAPEGMPFRHYSMTSPVVS